MSRTKVFVSYSHRDRDWLERLRQHLGVLERNGLVHVWSDTRITVGEEWKDEIESALGESRVAVLLVSPAFLASDYVWKKEMPRIKKHKDTQKMEVFPLIVRPCAWRIEEDLKELQARPTEGRALSTGSDAQVDLDLADFVYELAEQVDLLNSPLSQLPQSWTGSYSDYIPSLRLTVRERQGNEFQGSIEYLGDGTVTSVEGRVEENIQEIVDGLGLELDDINGREAQLALRFKETGYEIGGTRKIDLYGEYRALASGSSMSGAWFSGGDGRRVARFDLTLDDPK